ncbi:hypothetical protein [Parasutterella secunda]|uniref:DUF3299 domain-containing protein n=1 Tax=Parasutterella secunda TaxID=626947 RepID=A0ABS2GVL5_9BURK|nr:hypothetical protein [Parasutterella secunda]MBM6928908.1 hypothetical protein [Parasutterella secunda]
MKRRVFLTASLLMLAPWVKAKAAASIGFDEMYEGNPILGLQFSEKLKSLAQKTVSVQGFMAPPLKPEANFLVMTREPVSLCPFCNSDQDWPDNIIVVYLSAKQEFVQPNRPIVVTGTLQLGSYTDEQTGFVSLVRLVEATFEVLK